VVTKDYQLLYNADYTAIDGNVKISIDDIVNSPNMSQTVEVKNFIVKVGDCSMKTYTVTPDPVIFTENTAQNLAIHVSFAGQCFGDILILTADKVVTTTYPNVNRTDISESIWSETYDLKSETTGAGFIQFVSATPQNIALSGTGSAERPETSIVVFKVVDENGNPSPNITVNFELTTTIGGLSLINDSAQSDSDGLVQVVVKAGTVATHVRVMATLTATSDTVLSDELVVSTGIPDQDSFSISISSFNPEAWEYDGETVSVSILAADRFNNPVPDGLAIYFTTEGGAIEPSCTTANGSCTIEWRSQNPRPDDGRVTILATAIGEESFTDVNGNGRFDFEDKVYWDKENSSQGKPLWNPLWYLKGYDDLPDAFRDDNKNGWYDYGEDFFDFDENDVCEGNYKYNGLLCTDDAEEQGICTKELVHVRDDIVIVMSGSYADIDIVSLQVDEDGYRTVTISVSDYNGNSMPGGTTVDVETTNGTIVGETSFEVLNITEPLEFEVTLEPSDGEITLTVTVTTPKGHETTESIIVID
ncbi:MAG: Ig-like domain-containing protein, partial [Desulfobacterales bacterium]|nr:Ig-like domain-containing protein [Desulfobacterales bacterium]